LPKRHNLILEVEIWSYQGAIPFMVWEVLVILKSDSGKPDFMRAPRGKLREGNYKEILVSHGMA